MPRGFSEAERAAIRSQLLAHAEAQLIVVGLHKISVDELAQAAHISKGAFYQFFASKNELFVALFGEAERELREKMRKSAMQVLPDPREQVRAFFHESLAIYRGSPLLRNFKRRDFEMLLHEASSTQVAQAMGEDEAFYGEILEIWARRGLKIACSPAQFSGLMHSIFVSTLYVADFGAAYESVITLMISALADKLVVSSEARLL
ncbi:MAG: TetR/AcrR family transcriptional regulator [Chloroflexota bacterium]|jgi:AcrR family transcriptional regulator|nr:TetR/AcrR family transcriptional regulator [Chloroflexota bacterium]